MGWELELTDAVYNNDAELVKQYLQTKEVKKSIGELLDQCHIFCLH